MPPRIGAQARYQIGHHLNNFETKPRPAQTDSSRASVNPVNPDVLARSVGSAPATIARFLQLFLATAGTGLIEMRSAASVRSANRVASQAHKLKSASRTVGAIAFTDLCAQLERAGNEADWVALDAGLGLLEQEFASVACFIRAHPHTQLRAPGIQL